MKKRLMLVLVLVGMIGCETTITEEPKNQETKEPTTQDSPLTTNIQQLITNLGSDDWETREKAQKTLENWPREKLDEIEPPINKAAQNTNPEIRNRANKILRAIAVRKRVEFSQELLTEFPNIYSDFFLFDSHAKFEVIEKILYNRTLTSKGKYTEITTNDIIGLINEVLLDNGIGLNRDEKTNIINLCRGDRWNGELIKESSASLRKLLKDEDWLVRSYTAITLANLGDKESIPLIHNLIKDESPAVRREAVHALGRLDDKESIPEIKKLLKDKDKNVREQALKTLKELGVDVEENK
ncbi:MAG: HEAT repeat domain-containing protein [Planctomycetes bacterium]|nr:HEAT repeat domain-containing protein [Planctomycetota bacterium]